MTPDDKLVNAIVTSVPIYKHHPRFRQSVIQAKNLVMHYLGDRKDGTVDIGDLEDVDRDFIERLANALHCARIERGY